MWRALGGFGILALALAGCGSDSTSNQGNLTFSADYGWTCASGTNCQDVFDVTLSAGSALTIAVSNVSSGSVSQIALYAPGVALGGTNLLTGNTNELRCTAGAGCASYTAGEQVSAFPITQSGTYRLAVTREWGTSCGGTGTYHLSLTSTAAIQVTGQTVEDQTSQASGYECH